MSTVQTGYHRVGRSSDLKVPPRDHRVPSYAQLVVQEHREKTIRGIGERWNSSHYSNHDMYVVCMVGVCLWKGLGGRRG